MSAPLAIAGWGLITPAGRGGEAAWEALASGRSFTRPGGDAALAGFPALRTARAAPLDPGALGVDRRAARIMGRHTHMLLAAVQEALAAAGEIPGGEEVAFFAGMDSVDPGPEDMAEAASRSRGEEDGADLAGFFTEGIGTIPPLWPLGMLNAIGFCQVAIQHQFRGDNAVFSAGTEAALRAVAEAADSLREGKARLALAAGVSAVVSPRAVARLVHRGWLGADGGGPAVGEGAAALALACDVPPGRAWGRLLAAGSARVAGGAGRTEAIARVAAEALRAAGLGPEAVDLVVPHGSGAAEEDRAEGAALAGLLGERRPWGLAAKPAFGHLLGAGFVADVILACHALRTGRIPPGGSGRPDGERGLPLRFPPEGADAPDIAHALVLCQGWDGVCGAAVVAKA